MAIGTAAAIGLGATALGGALSSRSSSKAASKAADTSLAVAEQNNALAREIYGQNQQALSPFMTRGNQAGDAINALLGLGGAPANSNTPASPQVNALYQGYNPDTSAGAGYQGYGQPSGYQRPVNALSLRAQQLHGISPNDFFGGYGLPGEISGYGGGTWRSDGTQATPAQQSVSPAQAASDAFDVFRNSTGYQFRVNEGMDALNSGFAGAGLLRSGAALKALDDYRQGMASQEFGNYMGYLSNQQGVGLGGASALAGVGQNYTNTVTANNNNAGSAVANAALIKGQNNPFAAALGGLGGFLGGL